ncbi:hypothetical protein CT0861_12692, partial [Colletotrichum tofieldiae]
YAQGRGHPIVGNIFSNDYSSTVTSHINLGSSFPSIPLIVDFKQAQGTANIERSSWWPLRVASLLVLSVIHVVKPLVNPDSRTELLIYKAYCNARHTIGSTSANLEQI